MRKLMSVFLSLVLLLSGFSANSYGFNSASGFSPFGISVEGAQVSILLGPKVDFDKQGVLSDLIFLSISDASQFWVNLGVVDSIKGLGGRAMLVSDIGRRLFEADLRLKEDAKDILQKEMIAFDEVDELEDYQFRFWVEPDKVEVLKEDDRFLVRDVKLRVMHESQNGELSGLLKRVAGRLTERVNKDDAYRDVRLIGAEVALSSILRKHFSKEALQSVFLNTSMFYDAISYWSKADALIKYVSTFQSESDLVIGGYDFTGIGEFLQILPQEIREQYVKAKTITIGDLEKITSALLDKWRGELIKDSQDKAKFAGEGQNPTIKQDRYLENILKKWGKESGDNGNNNTQGSEKDDFEEILDVLSYSLDREQRLTPDRALLYLHAFGIIAINESEPDSKWHLAITKVISKVKGDVLSDIEWDIPAAVAFWRWAKNELETNKNNSIAYSLLKKIFDGKDKVLYEGFKRVPDIVFKGLKLLDDEFKERIKDYFSGVVKSTRPEDFYKKLLLRRVFKITEETGPFSPEERDLLGRQNERTAEFLRDKYLFWDKDARLMLFLFSFSLLSFLFSSYVILEGLTKPWGLVSLVVTMLLCFSEFAMFISGVSLTSKKEKLSMNGLKGIFPSKKFKKESRPLWDGILKSEFVFRILDGYLDQYDDNAFLSVHGDLGNYVLKNYRDIPLEVLVVTVLLYNGFKTKDTRNLLLYAYRKLKEQGLSFEDIAYNVYLIKNVIVLNGGYRDVYRDVYRDIREKYTFPLKGEDPNEIEDFMESLYRLEHSVDWNEGEVANYLKSFVAKRLLRAGGNDNRDKGRMANIGDLEVKDVEAKSKEPLSILNTALDNVDDRYPEIGKLSNFAKENIDKGIFNLYSFSSVKYKGGRIFIAKAEEGAIIISDKFIDNDIALSHEVMEWLDKTGRIHAYIDGESVVIKDALSGEVLIKKSYKGEVLPKKWIDEAKKGNTHYALRILQRTIFGEEDAQLSGKIRLLKLILSMKGKDVSDEDIASAFDYIGVDVKEFLGAVPSDKTNINPAVFRDIVNEIQSDDELSAYLQFISKAGDLVLSLSDRDLGEVSDALESAIDEGEAISGEELTALLVKGAQSDKASSPKAPGGILLYTI